jgi:hypothetical protein
VNVQEYHRIHILKLATDSSAVSLIAYYEETAFPATPIGDGCVFFGGQSLRSGQTW